MPESLRSHSCQSGIEPMSQADRQPHDAGRVPCLSDRAGREPRAGRRNCRAVGEREPARGMTSASISCATSATNSSADHVDRGRTTLLSTIQKAICGGPLSSSIAGEGPLARWRRARRARCASSWRCCRFDHGVRSLPQNRGIIDKTVGADARSTFRAE